MVRLTSITTKAGDSGQTGLGDGSRVEKSSARVEAMGTVDELNAVLGMAVSFGTGDPYAGWLLQIQNDLFDLGADLCFPTRPADYPPPLFSQSHVDRLDAWLEHLHPLLMPLESFILPGGANGPASLHWARTVCRRAERTILRVQESEPLDPLFVVYLNRLSDLLFQLARVCEDPAHPAPLWQPSKTDPKT